MKRIGMTIFLCCLGVVAFSLSTAELKYLLGNASLRAQNYTAALGFYEESIKDEETFIPAWQMKMIPLDKLGKQDEEDACLDKVLRLKQAVGREGPLIGSYLRAAGLANIGKYEMSVRELDKVLQKDLGRYAKLAWHEKGDALLYGLKKAEDAIVAYEKSLGLDSRNKLAWNSKGYAEFTLKKYEAALASFTNGSQVDENDDSLWLNRAVTLVYLKRYEDSLPIFDHALQLNPKRSDSWIWKAKALDALGKKDEAAACRAKAAELTGK